MVSYKGGHIARIQQIHKHNCEEPQQKNRFGTVSNKLLGWGLKLVLLDPNPRPQLPQWFKTFGPHVSFLTHQCWGVGWCDGAG